MIFKRRTFLSSENENCNVLYVIRKLTKYHIDGTLEIVQFFSNSPQYKNTNSFFETPEVDIIGISVLSKYGNELEIDTSTIGFNSTSP